MNPAHIHHDRCRREVELLEKLKKHSSILDFVREDTPEELTITFNGRGLFLKDNATDKFEFDDVHRIAIRLPAAYPQTEPDVRWLTPIFHPNVSFSGFVELEEIGLKWRLEMTLNVLCDRLWDVARLAYVNLASASNHTAKKWYESECALTLPIDARPLRNRLTAQPENVVSYRRREELPQVSPRLLGQAVMFIGDKTAEAIQPDCSLEPVSDDADAAMPTEQDEGIFFIG